PGGYLQWTEFDLSRARIYKANDSLKSSALERIIFPYDTAKPVHLRTRQTWVSELRGVLEEQGLETVVEERRRPSPYYRNVSLETSFMSYLEMSCKSADPAQGEALRKMISEAEEEVLGQGKGVSATTDWLTLVATRPTAETKNA
ncbi:uncharacterized protein PFLUO_LOCUS2226, partial [Penicillium psychrofluorescens]|uniref:uncharacterized protein n=1 Tax=Penicillium psychrofluorescens TaxID=3158075 RepID=UPI003CCD3204